MSLVYQHLPLIQIFRMVAEKGSFQKAADVLNLPRSSVSKRVQQLEQALGQPLFTRSTRKLFVTEFGQSLLKETHTMEKMLQGVDKLVEEAHQEPRGKVRLSTSVLLGQLFIIPMLPKLRKAFPEIELDLSFNDETIDLYEERVDIALRVGNLPDSSLIAKKVGEKTWRGFASPAYIEQHGLPEAPPSLRQHACLVFRNSQHTLDHWLFKDQSGLIQSIQVKPVITTDSSQTLVDMACAGLGIAMLDPLAVQKAVRTKGLIQILDKWTHPTNVPINLISLGRHQRSRASDAIWHYLCEHLKIEPV